MMKWNSQRFAGAAAAIFLLAAAATTACSLTVDTGDLSANGASGDGGPTTIIIIETPDATTSAVDAGFDATLPNEDSGDAPSGDRDGDADADAVSDAATSPDAADAAVDAPFCSPHDAHTLCFDFEEGNDLFAYSDSGAGSSLSSDLFGIGRMGLTTTGPMPFPSPPTAFLSTVTEADAAVTAQSGSSIQYIFPSTSVSRFELNAEMYLSQASALQYGSATVLSFSQISSKGMYSYVDVDWSTMGLQIANVVLEHATDPNGTQTVRTALPFSSTWQHVHTVVTRTAPMGHLLFTIDGVTVVDSDMVTLAADTQQITLELGLNTNDGTPAIGVLFDNVAVDVAY